MSEMALASRALDSDLSLGEAIEKLRRKSGMSKRQLSLAANLSESYVGKMEKGDIDPSLRAFARIVQQLGLSPGEVHVLVAQAATGEVTS